MFLCCTVQNTSVLDTGSGINLGGFGSGFTTLHGEKGSTLFPLSDLILILKS